MVKPDQDQVASVTISTRGAVLMVDIDGDPTTISTKRRRGKGQGTGRIQWRTVTKKNGKQYQQAWYDWQITDGGKTKTRTKYINPSIQNPKSKIQN
jgi:hypothetical protein